MSPRRLISVLGPSLGVAGLAGLVGCACIAWSVDLPQATAFVSRGLAETYGVALSAKGTTRISLLPLPRIGFRDVRLNAGGPDGPLLSQGGNLAIQLSLAGLLAGRAEVMSLHFDGPTVALPTDDADTRWAEPVRRIAQHVAAGDVTHPRRITITKAVVNGRDPRDGSPESLRDLDLLLSWPLWSDTLHGAGSLSLRGVTTRFAVTYLRPADLAAAGSTPFSISASWDGGSVGAQGTASTQDGLKLAGQGSLETRSLPDTLAWLGRGLPLSPLIEDIALSGSFEASRDIVRLPSVRVHSGETVLEGAGSIELSGRRPSLRATLATDALNLGPLLAGALRIGGLDGSVEAWGHRPLDLSTLTGGDLDLRLSATRARLGPVVLDDVASSVMVRADGIDAAIGRASVQGGTLKGRIALAPSKEDRDETEVKAQGAFDKIDLAALLIDLGQYGWILGPTQGAFVLEGAGRDAETLVRRVSGRASFAVDGGAIAGLDLTDVIHRGGGLAQGALARRNGRTPFDRAGVSLAFADGVGEITEGGLTARALTANLRGQLSLPDRAFKARAELLPRMASAFEVAATPSVLFEIAGPWDAVTVQPAPNRDRTANEPSPAGDPLRTPANALPTRVRAFAP